MVFMGIRMGWVALKLGSESTLALMLFYSIGLIGFIGFIRIVLYRKNQ